MRSLLFAAAILAGCSSGPEAAPASPAGGCACERAVCLCPHCKPAVDPAPKCPCKEMEKPR